CASSAVRALPGHPARASARLIRRRFVCRRPGLARRRVYARPMPLVLLHGIGTGPEAWRPQVEAFSPERSVLTPQVPLELDLAVQELDALVSETSDLCGLSWGGLVALRYALERPERVRSLVVCAELAYLPRPLRVLQRVLAVAARELAEPMRDGARFDVRAQLETLEPPLLVTCGRRAPVN